MAVIPMYYHYDECGTPCGAVDLNICGEMQHVDYFHHNRDGVDLVFVSHPAFYENVSAIYGGGDDGGDVARGVALASRDRGGVARPVRRLPVRHGQLGARPEATHPSVVHLFFSPRGANSD